MTKLAPKAPDHLRDETAAWFRSVLRDFDLDEHHVKLLRLAAEAFDRATEARETIESEGPYFRDRFDQPKAHPALAIERDSRIAFARLMRELDLDGEPGSDPRPPRRA